MHHQTFLFLFLLTTACTSCGRCEGQCEPIPDQGQIFSTTGIIGVGSDEWSQSVTTGIAGKLTGIQFQIENPDVLPADFDFKLFEGGNPATGSPLYGQLLTIGPGDLDKVQDGFLYTWTVTDANFLLAAGDVFCFSFSVQQSGVEIAGNHSTGYPGGELFLNGNPQPPGAIRDMAFISYVCADDVLLGDVNLDGIISLLDLGPFVDLLTSGGFQAEADINQDGILNLLDVEPFVSLLTGG